MGLLDALFDSSSYGGQSGGLLDLLRNSQMQQSQYQTSAGFPAENNQPSPLDAAQWPTGPMGAPTKMRFDSSMFDPRTFAPNQAQPVAVGSNYQMPRIGSADLYQPQQAMFASQGAPMQANAQMQQPQQQPALSTDISAQSRTPQPEQALPPALGGDTSFLGRIGNPNGLIARLTGNDSRSIAQQNLGAQFKAIQQTLMSNGESPQQAASKAMIAVMNPEAAKTILPELFTSKEKYQVVKDDPLSGKQYGFVNERDQTINGKPINSQPQSGGSLESLGAAQNAGVKGEALYEHLPTPMRNTVKAMLEGRQPLPSTTAMRSPATLALIDAAHAIDPTFDASVWKARNEAGPDWSKGKSSEMVRAANQTLTHVDSLMNAMDALKNRQMPAWNAVANTVSEQFGTGEQGSFRTNAHAVAEEMSKVFKGANLSDSEIRHWEQNLSENMSPTQQKAQIAKLSELLHGSLTALEKKRSDALGPAAAAKAPAIIGEEGQKVLDRVEKWTNGEAAKSSVGIQEGATATNPQTGAKITFRNGKWQ